jgi:LmbE family N-acetylglucosaminyl deacetylase
MPNMRKREKKRLKPPLFLVFGETFCEKRGNILQLIAIRSVERVISECGRTMKNHYYSLVSRFAKLLEEGIDIPVGGAAPTQSIPISPNAPKILLFSPHPDDESITGALPLRLLRELGMNVINVAVTLGRRSERKVQRWEELQNACKYLGFALTKTAEKGLDEITLDTRKQKPDRWSGAVEIILEILSENQPVAILVPHAKDCHCNHIGTHYLIVDALKKMPPDFGCFVVETEFWQTMETPNLLIESNTKDVSDLVTALSFHVGEVIRGTRRWLGRDRSCFHVCHVISFKEVAWVATSRGL